MREEHFRIVNNDENYVSEELKEFIVENFSMVVLKVLTVEDIALAIGNTYKRLMDIKSPLQELAKILTEYFPYPPKDMWGDIVDRMRLSDLGLVRKGE